MSGTAADSLVRSRFPTARFKYFNSALDAALAVKAGKADAVGYDEPILKNIAARNGGLTVLPELITNDKYRVAVRLDSQELKQTIDLVVEDLKKSGEYDAMLKRWLPASGTPGPMPDIQHSSGNATLRLGTAPVTEPFSYVHDSRNITGLDIELAARVAHQLNRNLEIVPLEFGAMIPALMARKIDMIAACITITPERSHIVLFSEPYYTGGIAAMVKR